MKKLIGNKYANFYLNAAQKNNLEYEIINERAALVKIYNDRKSILISANVLDLNSQLSGILAVNKKKTSLLLDANNIPVPAFKTFTKFENAKKYLLEMVRKSIPLVVKPVYGSLAIGITIKPRSKEQAIKALKEAFSENSMIIIEKFIPGCHYRVTVLDDEIIAITQRFPAFVIGNSNKTIKKLITEKNIERKKRKLPPILLRTKDLEFLKRNKIDLNKSYSEGETLILHLGCDLEIGGERKRINRDDIPIVNKELFIKAIKTLGLRFGGIDYISPDIMQPYTKVTSAINEINSAPHSDVHYLDTYPSDNYAAERIIEKIFNEDLSTEYKEEIKIKARNMKINSVFND